MINEIEKADEILSVMFSLCTGIEQDDYPKRIYRYAERIKFHMRKVELLLKQQSNIDTPPQLNKHEEINNSGAVQRKLFYEFSDGADVSKVVMELSGLMEWIKADEDEVSEVDDERFYTIVPIWLTDEEFSNLPEANI